jgi:hypothetical protein
MARKTRELTKLMVRLPAPLHRRLVRLAAAGACSLNSEIIRRLEHSVAVESPLSPDAQRVVDRVDKRIEALVELHRATRAILVRNLFAGEKRKKNNS